MKNELAILEFIHMVVETLDIYFNGVVSSFSLSIRALILHCTPLSYAFT
jgi:hypothetical protein